MNEAPASREDIRAFAEAARGVPDRLVMLNLGPVTHTGLILLKTGFDLLGFHRILDNYGVRHTPKQHGSPSSETLRKKKGPWGP
ncbi:hypothetical protein [Amphibiibacter pelophylacis]|uniref:Uncharacterized protein n=1 Tax=Amphibiibacter pelophylacis TaxID=1799477 RepID=A0ACC6P1V1_9BURK